MFHGQSVYPIKIYRRKPKNSLQQVAQINITSKSRFSDFSVVKI